VLIPRSYVEAYSRSLNDVSDRGRAALEEALALVDFTQDVASIREQVISIMQACCGASATMSARLAAEFYDGLRAKFGIDDGYQAAVEPLIEPEATEGAVRAFVQDLADEKPIEQFVGKCSDRLDYESRKSANRCIQHNVNKDPKKPKWARVPTGAETCEFCIMLASRGFVYGNEDLASHAHANCDCRVVPSWDKGKAAVEGYDPDEYLRAWEKLQEIDRRTDLSGSDKEMLRLAVSDSLHMRDVSHSKELVRRFGSCMEARRAEFLLPKPNLTQADYDRTVGALLVDIGDAYGMKWRGEFACGEKLYSAIPEDHEIWAVTRMCGHFNEVSFLSTDRRRRRGNPDLLVDGRYIDIKSPENPDRIGKSLTYASTQCRNRGQADGIAILSPLRLRERPEECLRTASKWINEGRISGVYVIGVDSSVTDL